MIRPVTLFSAFCHPECEHRIGNLCYRFNCRGNSLHPVFNPRLVDVYIRDLWCVIEETEEYGACQHIPRVLRKYPNES